jgi:acyl transferase domain-containing protein/3-hydroxymyristoyl/3-hydroxydecanoyl-(acyl carrier protein) dehydratase/1-acyl-sn-glycerol-3-phosphate acyltransferase
MTSPAGPIAIVGRGAVLPGAHDPATLWRRVVAGDDLTGPSSSALWGLDPARVCARRSEFSACARGGYVSGFEGVWKAAGFRIDGAHLATLPVGWRWLIHATREALREASMDLDGGSRAGLVLGSLGYPTREFAEISARRWCLDPEADSPALGGQSGALTWTMGACGLAGPRLAIDAACASGLYALKVACDLLRSFRADVMVAAGLNAADDLFLHIGFTALSALSPTARSSPLSSKADGLLPAQGAAVLVLKRLEDAVAAGDVIYGIVRGVGLANDGRGSGLLAPSTAGQQRAIRSAYASAGLDPAGVDLLECHATGTLLGDREELRSLRAVFGERATGMRLGSLKAQMGHLITASATAGLIKILGAMEHHTIPAAPEQSLSQPASELVGSAFQLPREAEIWRAVDRPRRAAINAFGFGGCNAHAVLDGPEAADELLRHQVSTPPPSATRPCSLALVAWELSVGEAMDSTAALRVLIGLDPPTCRTQIIDLPPKAPGFPPLDLAQTLAQQLLLLKAALAIRGSLEGIDPERTGLYVGADIDPAAARHGCRWRLESFLGRAVSEQECQTVAMPLEAAGVVGTMPNMPANRLNNLLDIGGPGFVISDGPASGVRALACAADAIRGGEIDAALVGAVEASGGAFGDDPECADAAVLLLLLPAHRVGGHQVLALLEPEDGQQAVEWQGLKPSPTLKLPWAKAGVAQALLELTVAALCCRHGLWPADPRQPWVSGERVLHLYGWRLSAPQTQGLAEVSPLLEAAAPATASDQQTRGELAWVFTGAAAAYPGAGRTLLRAFPEVGEDLWAMAPRLAGGLPALIAQNELSLRDQLQLATLVSQLQTLLLRRMGVEPHACLGLSSGETNALLATGAWRDPDALFDDVANSRMYERHLAGDHATLRTAWAMGPEAPVSWRCYRINHPVEALRAAIDQSERVRLLTVHHLEDAVIGGDEHSCLALISALGAKAAPTHHDLLVHCPEVEGFAAQWYAIHRRTTHGFSHPRLYANALHGVYLPSSDACARMLTDQAVATVDIQPTVERAWADGVRTFLEIGPKAACSGWIQRILEQKPHVVAAMDGRSGSLGDLAEALKMINQAGHGVDLSGWNRLVRGLRLVPPAGKSGGEGAPLRLNAHRKQPSFVRPVEPRLDLPPAPRLVPLLADRLRPVIVPAAPGGPSAAPELDPPLLRPPVAASLAALASCQEALLNMQALVIAQLETAAPSQVCQEPSGNFNPTDLHQLPSRPRGRSFSREELEIHAGGRISEIFGPAFASQDSQRRQVRMPMAPLLLADRVIGLVGEPGSMGKGTVWTETDIQADAWYLHHGRMPTGVLIESGQADLFLISWLGIDLCNRGDRVYRLLGCEITFHGGLPGIGNTLHYEIHIDSHARHGDIGLFFFHYSCSVGHRPLLTVRNGQAGFFRDDELAGSAGVLWDPGEECPGNSLPLDPPAAGVSPAGAYGEEQVDAFAAGDLLKAFGPAFAAAASHTRTPGIPNGRMQLFERVEALDPQGGPWGRGYLRAALTIRADQWFFPGHFKNDPCMPGTLMFEGCLQTMAFYLAAFGYTISRDGWRFEPVPERPYLLRCRGQVTPAAKELIYEVFVSEVHSGPEPMLVADLLCSVDGLKAFHCQRMALQLLPDVPFGTREMAALAPDPEPVHSHNGFQFGQASLLACANGDPVAAFGDLYGSLPPSRRVPRLPAPPYHFISRISSISAAPGGMAAGVTVETAYDLSPDAWYFQENPSGVMPTCVLIEAALQPCGWLASYVGVAVNEVDEVFFRNLDGSGLRRRSLRAEDGCLRVRSHLKSLARAGGMTLVGFEVSVWVAGECVYELSTSFGFFPQAALTAQQGMEASEQERQLATAAAGGADLLEGLTAAARQLLAGSMLRMLDRLTTRLLDAEGKARLRAEKLIRPDDWFFRAHFFQDPVQPGSLGVEALVQVLQAHLLLAGAAGAFPSGSFTDMVGQEPCVWRFRGQVLPDSQLVSLTMEAEAIEKHPERWTVRGEGSVWVDGRRIYQLSGLEVSFGAPLTAPGAAPAAQPSTASVELDPERQPWWLDHRPTFGPAVLPGMAAVSLALEAAQQAAGLDAFVLRRWLVLDRRRRLEVVIEGEAVRLLEAGLPLADGRLVAGPLPSGTPAAVPALSPLAPALEDPYGSGVLFHGPAYRRLISARRDSSGADLVMRIDPEFDGRERIPHVLLDVALHGVPHDCLQEWFPEVAAAQVAYPARIDRFRLYAPTPHQGTLEVRVRPAGLAGSAQFPRLLVQWLSGESVWAEMLLVEACFPATRLGSLAPEARRAFLRDGVYVPGARLSDEDIDTGTTMLSAETLAGADWLPGTVQAIYGPGLSSGAAHGRLTQVAALEHAAARLHTHPRAITVDAGGQVRTAVHPLLDYRIRLSDASLSNSPDRAMVCDDTPPRLDFDAVERWWQERRWQSAVPSLRPLFLEACRRFVGAVRLLDPVGIEALAGRPVILVANHQVAVESVLAGILLPPVLGTPLLTLAKQEHQHTWVGRLALGLNDPNHGPAIVFVDRQHQRQMLEGLAEMAEALRSGERSVLVHVEGTRALRGSQPVDTISAVWADLAMESGSAIVPLRFCGGLPAAGVGERQEFPVGFGRQSLLLGRPLVAADLAPLSLADRRARILEALADLEPYDLEPSIDASFDARVMAARQRWGIGLSRATYLLLQADACGWNLDESGLPAEAMANTMANRSQGDPFWQWFGAEEAV